MRSFDYARGLIAAALLLAACGAQAASGRVVDPDGRPVKDARACLLLPGERDGLCVTTTADGFFELPNLSVRMRITGEGFLPLRLSVENYEQPIALRRAASLRVRVLDAVSGKGIEQARCTLTYSNGKRLGPFPLNAAGLVIRTLEPGDVLVLVDADGYETAPGKSARLTGGQAQQVELTLTPTRETDAGES